MTAIRIFLASVLAVLVVAPAQAEDQQFGRVLAQCQEDRPTLPMVIDCVAERWDPYLEPGTRKHLSEFRVRLMIVEKILKLWARKDSDDGPPLRCADEARAGSGLLACSTEPLPRMTQPST